MNLDYTIYSDVDRNKYIDNYIKQHSKDYQSGANGHTATQQRQLQQMADYILFGKDPEKLTNAVQRKEIDKPQTQFSTFARKTPESLEALLENPNFSETQVRDPKEKNTYLHPKPTIEHNFRQQAQPNLNPCPHAAECPLGAKCGQASLEKQTACDTWIPGMIDLWDSIARMERQLKVAQHKVPPQENQQEIAAWSSLQIYRFRHWLADLRKHQYYLKDAYKTVISGGFSMTTAGTIDWESNSGHWEEAQDPGHLIEEKGDPLEDSPDYNYYRDQKTGERYRRLRNPHPLDSRGLEKFILLRQHKIDFTNVDHVYHIINNYRSLLKNCYDDLNGQMKWILLDFDAIAQRTQLSDVHTEILNYRILNWTNQRIAAAIRQEFGYDYNPNYISFMFKNNVCKKIAKTALLMQRQFEAQGNPNKWKHCSRCGEYKLIDQLNFVRKAVTKDGFSARCKKCDYQIRKVLRNREVNKDGGKTMQEMQTE